jgi:hypothetical protein
MPVSTLALQLAALTALKATGAPLEEPTLILFVNQVTPTKETVIGDLVEATFNGYAEVEELVFGTPYQNVNGQAQMNAPSVDFVSTDGVIQETVFGWALVNAAKTALYYCELLTTPVPITAGGQGVNIDPEIIYGN